MLSFLKKISILKSRWNSVALTQDDFYAFCRANKITVQEMPLRVSGFYYCLLGRHYIAVNSGLSSNKKLFVMFHEFAHYLMHAPDDGATANFHGIGKKTKKEKEADAFAICALIPRTHIANRTMQELVDDDGFSPELVKARIELLEVYGI